MIDFELKKFRGVGGQDKELQDILISHTKTIRKDLQQSKENFFYLGAHLIDLYNSNAYSVIPVNRAELRAQGLNIPIMAGNCNSVFFFHYCFEEFGLEKTQVSRLMNIVDEFGNKSIGFKECWKEFSYSQLCELLPLTAEQRKPVCSNWSVRRIREYKKSLVATSQQLEITGKNTELSSERSEIIENKPVATSQQTENTNSVKVTEQVRRVRTNFDFLQTACVNDIADTISECICSMPDSFGVGVPYRDRIKQWLFNWILQDNEISEVSEENEDADINELLKGFGKSRGSLHL